MPLSFHWNYVQNRILQYEKYIFDYLVLLFHNNLLLFFILFYFFHLSLTFDPAALEELNFMATCVPEGVVMVVSVLLRVGCQADINRLSYIIIS